MNSASCVHRLLPLISSLCFHKSQRCSSTGQPQPPRHRRFWPSSISRSNLRLSLYLSLPPPAISLCLPSSISGSDGHNSLASVGHALWSRVWRRRAWPRQRSSFPVPPPLPQSLSLSPPISLSLTVLSHWRNCRHMYATSLNLPHVSILVDGSTTWAETWCLRFNKEFILSLPLPLPQGRPSGRMHRGFCTGHAFRRPVLPAAPDRTTRFRASFPLLTLFCPLFFFCWVNYIKQHAITWFFLKIKILNLKNKII